MKSHTHYLWFETRKRQEIIDITDQVQEQVAAGAIQEGFVLVSAMHITASVFVNDDESGLHADYERWLEKLAPFDAGSDPRRGGYQHNRTGEDNADAHLNRQIMGREFLLAITNGKLDFGPLDHIFYF